MLTLVLWCFCHSGWTKDGDEDLGEEISLLKERKLRKSQQKEPQGKK